MPVFACDLFGFCVSNFLGIWFFGFRILCQENSAFGDNNVARRSRKCGTTLQLHFRARPREHVQRLLFATRVIKRQAFVNCRHVPPLSGNFPTRPTGNARLTFPLLPADGPVRHGENPPVILE